MDQERSKYSDPITSNALDKLAGSRPTLLHNAVYNDKDDKETKACNLI